MLGPLGVSPENSFGCVSQAFLFILRDQAPALTEGFRKLADGFREVIVPPDYTYLQRMEALKAAILEEEAKEQKKICFVVLFERQPRGAKKGKGGGGGRKKNK